MLLKLKEKGERGTQREKGARGTPGKNCELGTTGKKGERGTTRKKVSDAPTEKRSTATQQRRHRISATPRQKENEAPNEQVVVKTEQTPAQPPMYQLCCPGGEAQSSGILNVQNVVEHSDFLLVPMRTQEAGTEQAVVRGRKPRIESCQGEKCGKCNRCKSHAYWVKWGERHASGHDVVSVHDGKQIAWAVWNKNCVGCVLCHNFRLALTKNRTLGKFQFPEKEKCPWACFSMLITKNMQ